MTTRMIFPILLGAGGIAILLWLGFWQLNRLVWKENLIQSVQTRVAQAPDDLTTQFNRTDAIAQRNYVHVSFEGKLTGTEAHVFAVDKPDFGYLIVSELDWNGQPILLDLGFIPETAKDTPRDAVEIRGTGHVLTPQDYDPIFTPDPDLEKNVYFSRFLPPIAANLGTPEFMVVAAQAEVRINGEWVPYGASKLRPVTPNFKNDHREYAITWFSLALVWLGMTLYWLWRIKRKSV